jgi:hypothetical protein
MPRRALVLTFDANRPRRASQPLDALIAKLKQLAVQGHEANAILAIDVFVSERLTAKEGNDHAS